MAEQWPTARLLNLRRLYEQRDPSHTDVRCCTDLIDLIVEERVERERLRAEVETFRPEANRALRLERRLEASDRRVAELEQALRELVRAASDTANEHGCSGDLGARLSDARALLLVHEPEVPT